MNGIHAFDFKYHPFVFTLSARARAKGDFFSLSPPLFSRTTSPLMKNANARAHTHRAKKTIGSERAQYARKYFMRAHISTRFFADARILIVRARLSHFLPSQKHFYIAQKNAKCRPQIVGAKRADSRHFHRRAHELIV